MKSYPPIPDFFRLQKVTVGSSAVVDGGHVMLSSIAPANAIEQADLGYGNQLTRIKLNACDISFAKEYPFRLFLYASGTITEKAMSDFDTVSVDNETTTSFRLNYTDSSTSTVVRLTATIVTSSDVPHLTWEWDVTLAGTDASTYSIWALEVGRCRIKPFGPKDSINTFQPVMNGLIDTQSISTDGFGLGYQYPGNIKPDPNPYSLATGVRKISVGTASLGLLLHYSTRSGVALGLRTNDITGRPKIFGYDGTSGKDMETFVLVYPEDHLAATTFASTGYFKVQMIPFRGNTQDFAENHRLLSVEEGAPWVNVPEISQRAILSDWGGSSNISQHTANAAYVIQMDPHSTSGKTDGEVQDRLDAELARIESYFGTQCEMFFYRWGQLPDLTLFPLGAEIFDQVPSAHTASVLSAKSYPIYLYNIIHVWDPDSIWYTTPDSSDPVYGYNTAYADPSTLLMKDKDGATRQELDEGGDPRYYVNLGHADAQSHVVDVVDRIRAAYTFEGVYFDAFSGSAGDNIGDYNGSLSAAQTGPGSNYYATGRRSLIAAMRTALRARDNNFVVYSEFPDEMMVGLLDLVSMPSDPIPNGTIAHHTPFFTQLFSKNQSFTSYDSFVESFGEAFETIQHEVKCYQSAMLFHHGQKLMFTWFSRFNNYVIMQEGDDNYDTDWVNCGMKELREFQLALINHRIANPGIARGRRLRAPYGSLEHKIIEKGLSGTIDLTTLVLTINDDAAYASLWVVDDISWGKRVKLVVTNHDATAKTSRIRISREEYPEIGSGQVYVYEGYDIVKTFRDATYLDIEMEPYSIRTFDILDRDIIGEA